MEGGEEKVIVENFVQPGCGPAMHTHWKQDESLTVVKGKLGYQVLGEEERYAGPGQTVVFERGTPHRFWNAGEEELNSIGWIKPANSIVFFLTASDANGCTASGSVTVSDPNATWYADVDGAPTAIPTTAPTPAAGRLCDQ